MARQRKTRDTWELWVNYGQSWEHELTEYSRAEIKDRVREYRENCPQYPVRVRTRRERIVTVEDMRAVSAQIAGG